VRRRIGRAAERVGRDPVSVRLIAVSKTFGLEHVRAAVAAGQRDFGENRVQEALQKIAASADVEITWHLVGHLQVNKARKAASAFPWIHSVDSTELLGRLDRSAEESGASPRLLIQVDLANEPTKHGATPDQLPAIFERAEQCTAARVVGLMLLPPFAEDPEHTRPYFTRLRAVRDELLASGVREACLTELSMGMSHDFEIAVEEGSTLVRVGTAIFGSRHP
jgi:PLP dependent protein